MASCFMGIRTEDRSRESSFSRADQGKRCRILVRVAFLLVGFQVVLPFCPTHFPSTRRPWSCRLHAFAEGASSKSKSTAGASTDTIGQWEQVQGNYLLRPPMQDGPPRALLHFLGGALLGSAPHISYRYLLERLAAEGYLVVATPFTLSFDHLTTCDDVIERFERIAKPLAKTYGALPVVGIGHSCGSLLQLLITSLFPDTPRAANVLLSYSNKPVSESVPLFNELVIPFFTYVAARNETSRAAGADVLRLWLDLAHTSVQGELPADDVLRQAVHAMVPPDLAKILFPAGLRDALPLWPPIPPFVRSTLQGATAPWKQTLSNAEILPLVLELLDGLQQIPQLIDEVADGARDFVPPPAHVNAVAQRAYRARRTLLIQYTEDPLDESDAVEELLDAAGKVVQMKRPSIAIDVQRRNLTGGHATPLLAPPLDVATRAETLLGADVAKDTLFYAQADQTVQEIVRWLEESNL